MFDLPRHAALAVPNAYMKVVSLLGWNVDLSTFGFITLVALVVPTLGLYLLHRRAVKMQKQRDAKPFPFMELPPELRIRVYENLLEDPYFPPPPTCAKDTGSPLNWMLPESWHIPQMVPPSRPKSHFHGEHQSNWLFIANKQIYAEYTDILCKKTTFHLTVSPHNYTAATADPTTATTTAKLVEQKTAWNRTRTTPDTTTPTTNSQPSKAKRIWSISPDVLKKLHKCDIKLVATSPMLGVSDPRNMQPSDWALARQMREELKEVQNVRELNLHVKAVGDPLWNPLWVWFHASQSLKTMGTSAIGEEGGPTGPKLNRITFSLDTWSPGENYLERDAEQGGRWAWRCMNGHCTGLDGGADVTVREFCAVLYAVCSECRPELHSDDEGEEDDEQ